MTKKLSLFLLSGIYLIIIYDVIKVINKTSSTELVHIEKFISYKIF